MSTVLEKYEAAKTDRDAARAEVDKRIAAIVRANKVIADGEAELDKLAGAVDQAAEKHAERVQSWIEAGCAGSAPELVEDTKTANKRAASVKVGGELSATRKALAGLESAADLARIAAVAAEQAVKDAALTVLREEADILTRELVDAEARAAELRKELAGVSGTQILSAFAIGVVANPPQPATVDVLLTASGGATKHMIEWSQRLADMVGIAYTPPVDATVRYAAEREARIKGDETRRAEAEANILAIPGLSFSTPNNR